MGSLVSAKWKSAAAAVAALSLVGCGVQGNSGGAANNSAGSSSSSAKPLKIGVVTSLTGAIADYGTEWKRGFQIGMDYATNGTDTVDGRKISVVWKDDAGDPNQAVTAAKALLQNDKVDILAGCANSASAIAVEPQAQKAHTVFVVGPAVADTITGKNYNKYVFKVSPNSYMEAKAAVLSIPEKGATVAQLAPNYAFGWDSVKAFKTLATQARLKDTLDVYADPAATDFTPQLEKILQAKPKYLFVTWAGAPGPWKAIQDMQLQKQGITIVTGIPNIAAIQALFQGFEGMRGFTTYYNTLPNTPANDYLVKQDKAKFNTVPDLFDPDGMAAAIAIVDGLKKTGGKSDGNTLSQAMAGMSFDGPKGTYTFRSEDHQALQDQYSVELQKQSGVNYPVPVLKGVISADQTTPPILNK
ncbi:substrate-binding domain-containing protein [Alicyclobacillus dauci]|uniref:Substrate-binding domain-containing protein n=1 Tax=Alicyclobacillus dauci TaxID=1475485 RepID=A0ABY6Z098_9BACL|nr:substrate-binding domain-containing protein [Alicyclobacillus dauci]WAH36175.1 substrate-binding domain-containing protein [Alicyclobacillus dauci]